MKRNFDTLTAKQYDLLVIGGGISGAGVAHMAQDHGLQVALLEKGDFGSGTSSKSTKLIHGGIRYLEHFEFGLVMSSLKERALQLKAAPHLVTPLPFIIPVYKGDRRPLWMMRLGVFLYDLLAGKNLVGRHRRLTSKEVLKLVPGIRREGLRGGVVYYDAQMDDARLCLENILSAREKGAGIANYVEALSFLKEKEKVVGVTAKDTKGDAIFEIRAKKTVCAAGPWTNGLLKKDNPAARKRIRTTKGAHIVYKGSFSDHALLLPSDRDGRVFFVIPWKGYSLIGTTDTIYSKSPDTVQVLDKDIQYLVENAKRVFPDRDFSSGKIITSFAGLRPLVRKKGDPSSVTRDHSIVKTASGIIFVTGGKYTTYRKIAEDTLRKTFAIGIKRPFSLYGGGQVGADARTVAERCNVDAGTVTYLMHKYGTRYQRVLDLLKDDASLGRTICDCSPAIAAQVLYAIREEMALTADDIVARRLALQFVPCQSKACRGVIDRFVDAAA